MQTPFFTLMEMIRLICNAFDMGRPIKKELDNKATDIYVSLPEAMGYFRKPEIYDDLLWILGSDEGCEQFIAQVEESFKEYIEFMKAFDANGLSRDQVMPIVFRLFGHHLVKGRMIGIKHQFRVSVFDQENGLLTKALPPLIDQLKTESYAWQAMVQHAEKSLKDQLASWQRGEHLPDLTSLKVLLGLPGMKAERKVVLAARAWDFLLREFKQEGADPLGSDPIQILAEATALRKSIARSPYVQKMKPDVALIQRFFEEHDVGLSELEQAIYSLKVTTDRCENPNFSDFYCDWMLARVRARQERFDKCLMLNKQAVEKSSYRSFEEVKGILHQAMCAAAAIGPDRSFCKQIRKLQITFGFALPYQDKNFDSSKCSDHIQDWEIDLYAEEFHKFYQPADLKAPKRQSGPLIFKEGEKPRYDYRKPDKVISIKLEHGYKRMPQLAYAVRMEHKEEFNNLMAAGASVNCLTSSNESPLLLALEKLVYDRDPMAGAGDSYYFEQLVSYPHDPHTLNAVADKKRLSVLDAAVRTCNPDVVAKALALKPDVNMVATHDHCTPLYQAIGLLKASDPEFDLSRFIPEVATPEILEAFRRETNGALGNDLEAYRKMLSDPMMQECLKIIAPRLTTSNPILNREELIQIAIQLVEAGADSNFEHTRISPGFTPLVLAVGLGLTEVVEAMLNTNGNPKKTFFFPELNINMDCFGLADWLRQQGVLQLLSRYDQR